MSTCSKNESKICLEGQNFTIIICITLEIMNGVFSGGKIHKSYDIRTEKERVSSFISSYLNKLELGFGYLYPLKTSENLKVF